MNIKTRSRKRKILYNLLLSGVLGFLLWLSAGAPLPPELALRRLEWASFLTAHFQFQGSFAFYQGLWAAGLTEQWLALGNLDTQQLSLWPRDGDGPVLAPVPDTRSLPSALYFLAAGLPEEAVSGNLTLTLSCWYTHTSDGWSYAAQGQGRSSSTGWAQAYTGEGEFVEEGAVLTPTYWEQTYTAEGTFLEEGAALFRLERSSDCRSIETFVLGHADDWETYRGLDYQRYPDTLPVSCRVTAQFYDEGGRCVEQLELADIVQQANFQT